MNFRIFSENRPLSVLKRHFKRAVKIAFLKKTIFPYLDENLNCLARSQRSSATAKQQTKVD